MAAPPVSSLNPPGDGREPSSAQVLRNFPPELQLRTIADTAGEGIVTIDEQGIIASLSASAERMFGYGADELIGAKINLLMPSPYRENHDGFMEKYFRTGIRKIIGFERDVVGRRKNGTTFPILLRVAELHVGPHRLFTGFITDQSAPRQTEAELNDEKNLLSAILHTVATLITVIDTEGRIVRFNRACEELTGYLFEDIRGQLVWDLLLTPEETPNVKDVFLALVAEGKPNDYENNWRAKDGTKRLIAWRNTVLHGPDGKVSHIIATGIDVTDRRNAEAAGRELSTRFAATFENAAIGIAHVSPDGRWLRVNEKLCEITGYPREELLTKTFADITHPADVEADWKQALQLLHGEVGSYSLQKRYLHKRGMTIWVEITVSLVSFADGQPAYFITFIKDIAKAKEAELALRDSEQHLRRVLDNMYVFVGVLSPDGVLLHASRPPLEAAGITWAEVRHRKFWECYWWTHSAAGQQQLQRAVERASSGVPSRYDVEIRIAGDRRLIIDFMLSPMRADDGRISHLIASAVDITSRKQLEREVLEISEREQRRIGQDLHDDLCQRLTATEFLTHSVASDLSESNPPEAARVRKIAEYIRGSISHTRLLARGLTPVPISENGLVTALRELANSTEEMFSIRCRFHPAKKISVTEPELGSQLYRIAQEAITNAIRHGRATQIEISLQPVGDRVRMTIADNGCGLPRSLPSNRGMGLRIMQHRAGIIAATLEVRLGATGGTEVICTFPPKPEDGNARKSG